MNLKAQWWGSISKVKEEGTCRIAPEVDLWPSHALARVMIKTDPLPLLPWRDRDSTFTPNQDQARSQLRWEEEEGDFVTGRKLIQSHRSEKQHSELPKPSHGAQRASLASASVFTERDFGLLVLCKRLLNSRSSQCLFRELLDLSRSHKITQTLGA